MAICPPHWSVVHALDQWGFVLAAYYVHGDTYTQTSFLFLGASTDVFSRTSLRVVLLSLINTFDALIYEKRTAIKGVSGNKPKIITSDSYLDVLLVVF